MSFYLLEFSDKPENKTKNISQKMEKLLSESHGILFCSKGRMALINSDVR